MARPLSARATTPRVSRPICQGFAPLARPPDCTHKVLRLRAVESVGYVQLNPLSGATNSTSVLAAAFFAALVLVPLALRAMVNDWTAFWFFVVVVVS